MSGIYYLKNKVGGYALKCLNTRDNPVDAPCAAIEGSSPLPNMKDVVDWIHALESGNKISNPISPEEQLSELNKNIIGRERYVLNEAVKIISRRFPEVKNWIK